MESIKHRHEGKAARQACRRPLVLFIVTQIVTTGLPRARKGRWLKFCCWTAATEQRTPSLIGLRDGREMAFPMAFDERRQHIIAQRQHALTGKAAELGSLAELPNHRGLARQLSRPTSPPRVTSRRAVILRDDGSPTASPPPHRSSRSGPAAEPGQSRINVAKAETAADCDGLWPSDLGQSRIIK